MQKLIVVEDAKILMHKAAKDWSVWRWLLEKKKVRTAADQANAALAEAEKKVMASLAGYPKADVQRVKEAFDEAETVRLEAEDTFAEAERRLSTTMAREGSMKAVTAWEMREKAIRKAEALMRKK